MMRLTFDTFDRTPFPHGQCRGVFDEATYAAWRGVPDGATYAALLDAWPVESSFRILTGGYKKLSLSERCHPKTYRNFLASSPPWLAFFAYVKSAEFRETVFAALAVHGVTFPDATYTARFEFSSLPADGGMIAPHRDIASKILTIVVPMTRETAPGWGTDILEPLGPVGADYETPREAFRTVASFDYAPNTCGIFVKTSESWHAIGPIKGVLGQWRRTLTINVESQA